jgi:hypothetical protein
MHCVILATVSWAEAMRWVRQGAGNRFSIVVFKTLSAATAQVKSA